MSDTAIPQPLELFGAPGSPYTRKMVALLRYWRLPYAVHWTDPGTALDARGIARPRPLLLPVLLLPDGDGTLRAVCDSTPLIRRLQHLHGSRSVLPTDPVIGFLNDLLEDFADEWGTRYMFHYRWFHEENAANAAMQLPLGHDVSLPKAQLRAAAEAFRERQVGRLYVVGSTTETAPLIEASFQRCLKLLEQLLEAQPFLLGRRPASADFALYGQLTQLIGFEPLSRRMVHDIAPRLVAWTTLMEDQSGLDPRDDDWLEPGGAGDVLAPLLSEIGRVYAPTMLANARAVADGAKRWETPIDDARWAQPTFPYQAKCLRWLRDDFAALAQDDRTRVLQLLQGSGCETLFEDPRG